MACIFTYKGKSYTESGFKKALLAESAGAANAPMKSTSTWAMLGMKRAIKWAADHGFDRVAWAPGEVQAERYDLSKQVDQIEVTRVDSDARTLAIDFLQGQGSIVMDVGNDGRILTARGPQAESLKNKTLDETVGKELAEKIMTLEAPHIFSGVDLRVGGEGMRAFYDRMLPSEMKKYVKKFGGMVEATEINVEGKPQQVWSTTLTPALKDEALAGQRLYSIPQQIRDLYDQGYNEVVGDWSKGDVGMAARFQRWIQDVHNILAKLEKKKGVSAEDSVYEAENKVRSQQAEANRVLDEKWVFPMLKLIGKNKWSVKQVDKAIYARAAKEVNAHLREVSAKIWLRRLAASMDDAGQRKLLEKAIEKVKAETSSKVNVGGKEVTKVEVKARRQQMYALLKEWASKDPDTTSISQPIIDKFWEYDSKPSGMTDDEADTEMKKWVGDADMQQLFLILDDMNAQSLNALVASGMISQEMALKWRGTNPHYVTLRRAGFEEQQGGKGQGHSAGRASSLRAGSTKPAVDVFSNTIMTARRYITLNHNNELMQKFYDMVKNPAYDFKNEFEISVGDQVKYLDKDGFLDEGLTKAEDNELEMRVWFNGKKYLIRAKQDNPQMRAIVGAMNNLDSPAFGPVTKFFAKANHFMARMNTSLSPEFFFTNPIRDLLEAQMNMSDSEADKVRGAVLKSLPGMWKGLWQIYRGRSKGEDMTSHPLYWVLQQYEEAGVPSSWLAFHETAADHTKALERQIKQLSPDMSLTKASHIAATFIEDTNRMAENALRLATFKALLDAGVKVGRAATIVKELTVNFDRRGSAGPAINAFYMFANASIQGSTRVFRAMLTNRKVQKLAAGVVVAAILSEWANGSDDDWDKIDEKKKQRNLIFRNPTGVGPEFVSIPAPWGYNVLWTFGRKIGEGMRGKRGWTAGGASVDLLENVLDSFNPIQGGTLAQTLAPTLGRPIVQIAENKDWTGERPLRPTPFPGQPTPESQQMWESTSIISKTMAGLLNAATGGDRVTSGWIDISPTSLDAWASQIFGATGNTVRSILNLPSELTDPMKEFEVGRLPVLRKFSAAPNASIEGAVYHERVAQIHDIAYRLKKYEEGVDKDLAKARELRVGSRQLLALEPAMKEAEKQLTDLRKRMAVAQASGSDERVRAMRQRMKEVRERFNQTFERRVGE